jgi:hypothetical protein
MIETLRRLPQGLPELILVLATPQDGSGTYLTPMLWSPPGDGKSSCIRSLFANQRCEIVSAALHEPFDFGGFPLPCADRGVVRYLPPDWAVFGPEEEGCIFLDDAPLANVQTYPALMKLALERTIGTSYRIGPNVKVVLAGNPNFGCSLTDPIASRLVHIHYDFSLEQFVEALTLGEYPSVQLPKPLDQQAHQQVRSMYRLHFASFLRRFPKLVSTKRATSDLYPNSFCTKRTIEMAIRLCATSELMGVSPTIAGKENENADSIFLRLMQGTLGSEVAVPWVRFLCSGDRIVDPRDVLTGEVTVNYKQLSDDLLYTFFCSLGIVMAQLETESPKAFLQASMLFCEQIALLGNRIDVAYAPIRSLIRNQWYQRASLAAREMDATDEWNRIASTVFQSDGPFSQLGTLVEKELAVGVS